MYLKSLENSLNMAYSILNEHTLDLLNEIKESKKRLDKTIKHDLKSTLQEENNNMQ